MGAYTHVCKYSAAYIKHTVHTYSHTLIFKEGLGEKRRRKGMGKGYTSTQYFYIIYNTRSELASLAHSL